MGYLLALKVDILKSRTLGIYKEAGYGYSVFFVFSAILTFVLACIVFEKLYTDFFFQNQYLAGILQYDYSTSIVYSLALLSFLVLGFIFLITT